MTSISRYYWWIFRKGKISKLQSASEKAYQNIGCNMSLGLELYFLCSRLDFFHENLGSFICEHREKTDQEIEPMQRWYKGCWDSI